MTNGTLAHLGVTHEEIVNRMLTARALVEAGGVCWNPRR